MKTGITQHTAAFIYSGHRNRLAKRAGKLAMQTALVLLLCMSSILLVAADPIETNIFSSAGYEKAWLETHFLTRTSPGIKPWTAQVNTIYIPRTGMAWAGAWTQQYPTVVEDRIVSIYPALQPNNEYLGLSVSTNKHAVGLTNVSTVMQAELAGYENGSSRLLSVGQYGVRLEILLGSITLRDYEDTNMFFARVFANITRPTKFKDLTVEGTNAVVSLEIGTNILARIAFNKHVVPLWATTNGVSIGPIPTNCVFYSDIVSNKVVTKVIY